MSLCRRYRESASQLLRLWANQAPRCSFAHQRRPAASELSASEAQLRLSERPVSHTGVSFGRGLGGAVLLQPTRPSARGGLDPPSYSRVLRASSGIQWSNGVYWNWIRLRLSLPEMGQSLSTSCRRLTCSVDVARAAPAGTARGGVYRHPHLQSL